MKQKIIGVLFLSGTMLVPNLAFADSKSEAATETLTVTETEAVAAESSEPQNGKKYWRNCPSSPAIFKPAGTTAPSATEHHRSRQNASA